MTCNFFLRGHGNEFNNLIGSITGPDFPISAYGHDNSYIIFLILIDSLSFWLGIYLNAKALNSFLLGSVCMEKSCTGLKGYSPTRADLTWAS